MWHCPPSASDSTNCVVYPESGNAVRTSVSAMCAAYVLVMLQCISTAFTSAYLQNAGAFAITSSNNTVGFPISDAGSSGLMSTTSSTTRTSAGTTAPPNPEPAGCDGE